MAHIILLALEHSEARSTAVRRPTFRSSAAQDRYSSRCAFCEALKEAIYQLSWVTFAFSAICFTVHDVHIEVYVCTGFKAAAVKL